MKFIILCFILSFVVFAQATTFKITSHGYNKENTRNVNDLPVPSLFTSKNIENISMVWAFQTAGWETATPAYYHGRAYFPDRAGYLYAVEKLTGNLVWSVFLPGYTGIEGDYSRTTPTIREDFIVLGMQGAGRVLVLHLHDGSFAWSRIINDHPAAVVTMSPQIHQDVIFVGSSSLEELFASNPLYPCCNFRGNFVALRLNNGNLLWDTPLIDLSIPVGPGTYSGVAAWGSSPVIDPKRNSVYFATGNPYNVSQAATICHEMDPSNDECIDAGVYFNGVLSLDMDTGAIKWYRRLTAYDAWNVACPLEGPNCPPVPGDDADFGMAPALKRDVRMPGGRRDVLLIGQKSGVVWNINAHDGATNWGTQVGPGGSLGGLSWGAALDDHRYIVGLINNHNECWEITSPMTYPCIRGGGWIAVNIIDGSISWQTPAPKTLTPMGEDSLPYTHGSMAAGPGAMVNDLFIAGSTVKDGTVVIMNKYNGKVLFEYDTGATIYGGPSIADDCFFIGHGYNPLFNPYWTEGNHVFAFCLPEAFE